MAVVTSITYQHPDSHFYIIFLPFVPIPAVWVSRLEGVPCDTHNELCKCVLYNQVYSPHLCAWFCVGVGVDVHVRTWKYTHSGTHKLHNTHTCTAHMCMCTSVVHGHSHTCIHPLMWASIPHSPSLHITLSTRAGPGQRCGTGHGRPCDGMEVL